MKIIKLTFDGYWTEIDNDMIDKSGIYCVYRGVKIGDRVKLIELIYIGESENVKKRIQQHIADKDWKECLEANECFCYSNAYVESQARARAEAALIYHYKPKYNNQHKDNYGDYAGTTIITSGKNHLIESGFTVEE